ncbi:NAD(P)H-dependent oxidoreductase [Amycolatopsis sp.]|uniref:NADPH-dependent FMN reductase n=1 Tax=Amycolatopsis sp. TaxID=37632 RepID=UPI002D7ECAA9|nr:NAD(P)H-dependent oxidoreductase [Amycolatopsis sp.]HET6711197.1 NAD(P)H-dependent oxidoreductase [Amycolatopsis sp.]
MEEALRVAVLIGSTREGRAGAGVGRWFTTAAARRAGLDLDSVDLADADLPAAYPAAPTPALTRFRERIARAEAYVVVTPEYNRSFPGPLKQAIDFAYDEWHAKPVGFVSYGYRARGRHAVEHLRDVFLELHTVTMRDVVALDLADPSFDDGHVTVLLDELTWWGLALRDARRARPYCA